MKHDIQYEWRTPKQDELENGTLVKIADLDISNLDFDKPHEIINAKRDLFPQKADRKIFGDELVDKHRIIKWKKGRIGGNSLEGCIKLEDDKGRRRGVIYYKTGTRQNSKRHFPVRLMEAYLPRKRKKLFKINITYLGKEDE